MAGAALIACAGEIDGNGEPLGTERRPVEADAAGARRPTLGIETAAGRASDPVLLFLGTSLTAGYGLDDPEEAFPALLGRRLAQAGGRCRIVNAGVSGDTSTGGRARLESLLTSHGSTLALLFLELGANDALRGHDPDAMRDNLNWIARETRRRRPNADVVLAGMEAPTNMGPSYTRAFRDAFARVAEANDAPLIPFLLEGVAAEPSLNQSDGIHPNRRGHAAIARHVWASVGERLLDRCPAAADGEGT